MKFYTASAIALLCSLAATAQEKIDTDRPDQTESAFLVPARWVQFEIGFNKESTVSRTEKTYLLPTLLSKYGINKNFELRLITTIESVQYKFQGRSFGNSNGLLPVQIGAKIRLAEETGIFPKTSLIWHVALPGVASPKKRADKLAPNFRFTMQNSLGKNAALGYNLGAEWDGYSNNPTWIYTFAPGLNIGERWYGYVEAFGFITKEGPPRHSLDAGIAWYATNNFKIDFSGGFGISPAAPPWYASVGASVRFNTAKNKKQGNP
jgi:Putative MetA-pathway of phenol degradation